MPSMTARLRRIEGLLRSRRRDPPKPKPSAADKTLFPWRRSNARTRKVFAKLFNLAVDDVTVGDVLRLGADKFYDQRYCGTTTVHSIARMMLDCGATQDQIDRWLLS